METMGESVSSLDPVSETDIEHPKAPSSCSVRTEAWPPAELPTSDLCSTLRDSEDDLETVNILLYRKKNTSLKNG